MKSPRWCAFVLVLASIVASPGWPGGMARAAEDKTPPLSITLSNGDFSKPIGAGWKKEGGIGSVFGFEHDTKLGHNAAGSLKTWVSSLAQMSRVEALLSGNMPQVGDTVAWQGWIYSETEWKSSDKKLVLQMYAFEKDWKKSRQYTAFPDVPAKQWTFFSIEFSRWSEAVEFYWACVDMHAVGTFWFDDMKIVAKEKAPLSGQQPTDAAEKTMGPKSGERTGAMVETIEKAAPEKAPAQSSAKHPELVIVKAVYGDLKGGRTNDVTETLRGFATAEGLIVTASNGLFGDPAERVEKHLKVEYTLDAAPLEKTVRENELLKIGHVAPEEGWFEFAPGRELSTPAVLDMRALLNEPQAGSRGRVIAKGGDLVFEKTGQKVRFWGVVADSWLWPQPKESIDHFSRRLARAGVNLVRMHIARGDSQPDRFLDTIHYMVHALKEQGIYVYLNWYCTACNIEYSGICYFDPAERERHRAWARSVLEPKNPYTGMSLAHDPAVVAVELLDEDSIFWFTFNAGSPWLKPKLPILEKRFGDWLAKEYGALDKAVAAWGPGKYPEGDDMGSGRVAIYPPYLLGGANWARDQRNEKRAQDQARFMTGLMRDFYGRMKAWLRDELGYTGLVVGSNWKTADERTLGPLDQYANLAVDITARNTYFEAPGVGGPIGVAGGDVFNDHSALSDPEQMAMLMNLQCADHPHMMTEGGWTLPNRFRTEEPLLVAAYYSLQGIDGYCPFRVTYDWLTGPDKWPIMTPATLGQYPAASIIYRRGYIKQGPVAINEALSLKDAYALKGGALSQPLGLDALQAARVGGGQRAETDALAAMDPLAFFVGPVVRTIAEDPGKSFFHSYLPKLIDRQAKVVRSATGELTLDYGRGIATMDAPCAQGAAGFLGATGQIALSDVTVDLKNEYGAVMVVSLDGKRLKESAKILVQVMTEEKFTGWKTEPARIELEKGKGKVDCQRIISTGGSPILVRQVEGAVTLKRADAAALTVTALDANGYAIDEPQRGVAPLTLKPDCMYYVISKDK